MQKIITFANWQEELTQILLLTRTKKIFLVCGQSFLGSEVNEYFDRLKRVEDVSVCYFCDFSPNPDYNSVIKGVHKFKKEKCDFIVGAGGGSAMDVAKCIKLFSPMDSSSDYLSQQLEESTIPFLAIPTTSGSGSEATRFAVIYVNGEKKSVAHESGVPDYVFFHPLLIQTVPLYQRKTTMMDALSHAIEASWSINSTAESQKLAGNALKIIFQNLEAYLNNTFIGNRQMQYAAYLAGQAINISETTACHAMSYKITSIYGLSHGHAVALCLPGVWQYMLNHMEQCVDPRGVEYVESVFIRLAHLMGACDPLSAIQHLYNLQKLLDIEVSLKYTEKDLDNLAGSVNKARLKNNPVFLDYYAIKMIYKNTLSSHDNVEVLWK